MGACSAAVLSAGTLRRVLPSWPSPSLLFYLQAYRAAAAPYRCAVLLSWRAHDSGSTLYSFLRSFAYGVRLFLRWTVRGGVVRRGTDRGLTWAGIAVHSHDLCCSANRCPLGGLVLTGHRTTVSEDY